MYGSEGTPTAQLHRKDIFILMAHLKNNKKTTTNRLDGR